MRSFTSIFLIFFIIQTVQAQVIKTKVIDKSTGEEMVWCPSFIVDPVDSTVIGYGESDLDGETRYRMLRSLRSDQFLVKFCDIYQKDTVFQFGYEENKKYEIGLIPVKELTWFTVYYNEKGIVDYNEGVSLFGCSPTYLKRYHDSLTYYHEQKTKRLNEDYEKEYAKYLKQVTWVLVICALMIFTGVFLVTRKQPKLSPSGK